MWGFATTGGTVSVMLFMARKSWTKRYFPVDAFLTGKMGVLQVAVLVFIRIPAFSMSAITGLIPSVASFESGYWGLTGLCDEVVFTITGVASFINPTSVGPDDQRVFGSVSSSGGSFVNRTCHHWLSSIVMWVAGVVLITHPRARRRQWVLLPLNQPSGSESSL